MKSLKQKMFYLPRFFLLCLYVGSCIAMGTKGMVSFESCDCAKDGVLFESSRKALAVANSCFQETDCQNLFEMNTCIAYCSSSKTKHSNLNQVLESMKYYFTIQASPQWYSKYLNLLNDKNSGKITIGLFRQLVLLSHLNENELHDTLLGFNTSTFIHNKIVTFLENDQYSNIVQFLKDNDIELLYSVSSHICTRRQELQFITFCWLPPILKETFALKNTLSGSKKRTLDVTLNGNHDTRQLLGDLITIRSEIQNSRKMEENLITLLNAGDKNNKEACEKLKANFKAMGKEMEDRAQMQANVKAEVIARRYNYVRSLSSQLKPVAMSLQTSFIDALHKAQLDQIAKFVVGLIEGIVLCLAAIFTGGAAAGVVVSFGITALTKIVSLLQMKDDVADLISSSLGWLELEHLKDTLQKSFEEFFAYIKKFEEVLTLLQEFKDVTFDLAENRDIQDAKALDTILQQKAGRYIQYFNKFSLPISPLDVNNMRVHFENIRDIIASRCGKFVSCRQEIAKVNEYLGSLFKQLDTAVDVGYTVQYDIAELANLKFNTQSALVLQKSIQDCSESRFQFIGIASAYPLIQAHSSVQTLAMQICASQSYVEGGKITDSEIYQYCSSGVGFDKPKLAKLRSYKPALEVTEKIIDGYIPTQPEFPGDQYFVNLTELTHGVAFKLPTKPEWLTKYNWVPSQILENTCFVKKIVLYIPTTSRSSSNLQRGKISARIESRSLVCPRHSGGVSYIIPNRHYFPSYEFTQCIDSDIRDPFSACHNRCIRMIDSGAVAGEENAGVTQFYPSIMDTWMISANIESFVMANPNHNLPLKASVTLKCNNNVPIRRKRYIPDTARDARCCPNGQYFQYLSNSCLACPQGSTVDAGGLFCEKN